jgi:hypothetical protein
MVDDTPVQLQVLRTPGGSAAEAIDVLVAIEEPTDPPTLSTATIGGKTVTVATDSAGDEEYYYVSGDIAWFLAGVERSQAEVIFAALP